MRIGDWSSDVCSSDLLIVGCLVDTVPAILIFVPILQPTAVEFGIDPIHFAIVVIVNLMIGLNTPPIGTNLFVIRSKEHTSELQSLMRNSYAVFCFKKKITYTKTSHKHHKT